MPDAIWLLVALLLIALKVAVLVSHHLFAFRFLALSRYSKQLLLNAVVVVLFVANRRDFVSGYENDETRTAKKMNTTESNDLSLLNSNIGM